MKKLIALSLLLCACHRSPSPAPTPASALGAADPKTAVGAFIAAINAQDLQAMSSVWGDADGSVRNQMKADELMQREVVMIQMLKCVRKDFRIVSNVVASTNQRSLVVEMNFMRPTRVGDTTRTNLLTRSTDFIMANDKIGRWFVQSLDLGKVNDVCLARG